ncbi:methionine--tRNA ligase [Miltoncostaea marina]|uniref:methionine--tRNA ligase n=1 Tax=Miltoncostaea marina TaxID=2843215 RepID=UPI001C3D3F14|nr:methionine--tRNA ligase [Miltoncostaea marina]
MADGRFYLTTPIYYVNADPHIGHAYTTIMADIVARHHRQLGEDVFFLTGTDEHGGKIATSAEREGRTPREHADLLSARFRDLGGVLDASYDFFIRTTDPEHEAEVQRMFQALHDSGDVYRGSYGGWYCSACEAFYGEGDLLEGRLCPIHRTPVEWVEEDNWFFDLPAYRDRLLAHYDANPDWVQPQARYNEARRMIELGLEELSVSRAQVEWGVPVPWDPEQTIYVWIDALLNYRTALGYARPGEDLVARYWPPDLQLMAKDILKFHAVIWPAMLMAAGLELPRKLMIHGYVLKGGEKMSKTTGNVVDPFPFIERYGIDALRYYLAREVRFGEDGTFTAEGFEGRYSQELANELGNLLNRVVSMVGRYRDGVVPADAGDEGELAAEVAAAVEAARGSFARLDISRAIEEVWRVVQRLNRLVEQRAPWTLAKDPARAGELDATLHALAEGLRIVAILLWPVIPGSAERVLAALGQDPAAVALERAAWGAGAPSARVAPSGPLFPRVEEAAA